MSDWANFTRDEFKCQHCGRNEIRDGFIDILQVLRTLCGFGFNVRGGSGYRCPDHPIEAAKTGGPGSHSLGITTDIPVSHAKAYTLFNVVGFYNAVAKVAQEQGRDAALTFILLYGVRDRAFANSFAEIALSEGAIVGIGIDQSGPSRFIHLDLAPSAEGRPRPHLWTY